jgi:hypothetical protein
MREAFYLKSATELDELNLSKEHWWEFRDRERTKRVPLPLCAGNDTEQLLIG